MEIEKRLIDAKLAQHIADVELTPDEVGVVQWVLSHTPTVDAVEVVHSSWILNDDGSGTCKHCHRTTKSCWDFDNQMHYCPNCGAKMDGGVV